MIASSQCKLLRGINDPDPLFCRVILTDVELVFLNAELSRQDEPLFRIPLGQIKNFSFISEEKKSKRLVADLKRVVDTWADAIVGILKPREAQENGDRLALSFVDEQGNQAEFILDMMEYGERGLVRKYNKWRHSF